MIALPSPAPQSFEGDVTPGAPLPVGQPITPEEQALRDQLRDLEAEARQDPGASARLARKIGDVRKQLRVRFGTEL